MDKCQDHLLAMATLPSATLRRAHSKSLPHNSRGKVMRFHLPNGRFHLDMLGLRHHQWLMAIIHHTNINSTINTCITMLYLPQVRIRRISHRVKQVLPMHIQMGMVLVTRMQLHSLRKLNSSTINHHQMVMLRSRQRNSRGLDRVVKT